MNKTIWKYPLPIEDRTVIDLPLFSKILSVGVQGGECFLWVLHDTHEPKRARTFRMVGTGHQFPPGHFTFIGTIQIENLGLVFHIFEEG
jgi:hypothetical protein